MSHSKVRKRPTRRDVRSLARLVCVIAFFATPIPAFAVDPPGWVGPADIEYMSVHPNGRFYVKLGVSTPDLGCTGNTDGLLELNRSFPHFKEQYSFFLSAYLAGRQVEVYVAECGYFPYAQSTKL